MLLGEVAWIFVCQSGRLEREACVLAASLRKMLGDDARLIAAVPLPVAVMGTVQPQTVDFLKSIGIVIQEFVNELAIDTASETDMMMNKAFALEVDPNARVNVFLDSDQLCFAALDLVNLAVPMVGRKVFYPGAIATAGIWQRAYEICDIEMPRQRLLVQSREQSEPAIVSPPCFNSGINSVHRPWLHSLVGHYVDCYRRINEHNLLGEHRYFTEQTALALAVIKSGVPYEIDNHRLDRSLFHYYSLPRLASFVNQAKFVASLVDEFFGLRDLLADDGDWQRVIAVGKR